MKLQNSGGLVDKLTFCHVFILHMANLELQNSAEKQHTAILSGTEIDWIIVYYQYNMTLLNT